MNIGEAVELKSGGPAMLVKYKGKERVVCVWIGDSGKVESRHFPIETLILLPKSVRRSNRCT